MSANRDRQWEMYSHDAEAYWIRKSKKRELELVKDLQQQTEHIQKMEDIILKAWSSNQAAPAASAPGLISLCWRPSSPSQPAQHKNENIRIRSMRSSFGVWKEARALPPQTVWQHTTPRRNRFNEVFEQNEARTGPVRVMQAVPDTQTVWSLPEGRPTYTNVDRHTPTAASFRLSPSSGPVNTSRLAFATPMVYPPTPSVSSATPTVTPYMTGKSEIRIAATPTLTPRNGGIARVSSGSPVDWSTPIAHIPSRHERLPTTTVIASSLQIGTRQARSVSPKPRGDGGSTPSTTYFSRSIPSSSVVWTTSRHTISMR